MAKKQAIEVDDTNPALHLHHAMYALRANEYEAAFGACEAILDIDWDAQRRRLALYFRARIHAHQGRASLALMDLRAVLEDPNCDTRLATGARKAQRSLLRRKRLKLRPNEISPMSWMPDAFRYGGIL